MESDFDIVKYVNETLKPLDIPVFFSAKREVSPPLVVFNVNGERGNKFWDDEEAVTVYKVTVNIFSRQNFMVYKNKILSLMKQAGFMKYDVPACFYLEDIDVYNQPIEFRFYKENY